MTQAKGVNARFCRVTAIENVNSYGADPSSLGAVKLPINSIDLHSERNLITPGTITGRRDAVEPAQGYVDVTGSAVVPVEQCAVGYWLQMLLGYPTTTSIDANLKTHQFDVSSKLNSFTGEIGYTDIGAYQRFRGLKAAGMNMRVGGDEELVMNVDLKGANDAIFTASSLTPLTTISLNRFNNFHATLQEGGASLGTAREVELTINNNLDESVYTIGGGATRGDLPEGFCNVTGRIQMLFENWSYYTLAYSGTERSLLLKFETGSFYLQFDIDELVYQRMSPGIQTPEGIWQELSFQSFYNDGGNGTVLRATLVNTWASYSAQA